MTRGASRRVDHRDSMLFAWVLEQIARWRPYSVVAARSQMVAPLVEEALLGVPLADQWSCRVSRRRGSESEDEKEYFGLSKPTQASLALNLR